MRQLNAMDTSFLYRDRPHAPSNAAILWIYDRSTARGGSLTFEDVHAHIGARLHLIDALREKLVSVPGDLDRPWWVRDSNFDLEYHLRNIALPPPGDWRQFCVQLARLTARPLDLSRPMWELYMIEGLDDVEGLSAGSFALLLKVHHAAVDGEALVAIMDILNSPTPEPDAPPSAGPPVSEREPSNWELLARAGLNAARSPARTARVLGNVIPGFAHVATARGRGNRPSWRPPTTRFDRGVSPHRVLDFCLFDLAAVKPVRAAVQGATVNDIVTSVVGGTLRKYLGEIGELPP